jgi:UDP:flavonoid glycosyltransferase YjiC (YdhE family)
MGSTQKALAHGVPVCVVPFGRDQLEVARRVEVAEAGTRLSARRLGPAVVARRSRSVCGSSTANRRTIMNAPAKTQVLSISVQLNLVSARV